MSAALMWYWQSLGPTQYSSLALAALVESPVFPPVLGITSWTPAVSDKAQSSSRRPHSNGENPPLPVLLTRYD